MRHRAETSAVAALLLLAALPTAPAQERRLDLGGAWTVRGRDADGPYRGTATLVHDASGRVTGTLTLRHVRWHWPSLSYRRVGEEVQVRLEGTLEGQVLRGVRRPSGLAGALPAGEGWDVEYAVGPDLLEGDWRPRAYPGRAPHKRKGRPSYHEALRR